MHRCSAQHSVYDIQRTTSNIRHAPRTHRSAYTIFAWQAFPKAFAQSIFDSLDFSEKMTRAKFEGIAFRPATSPWCPWSTLGVPLEYPSIRPLPPRCNALALATVCFAALRLWLQSCRTSSSCARWSPSKRYLRLGWAGLVRLVSEGRFSGGARAAQCARGTAAVESTGPVCLREAIRSAQHSPHSEPGHAAHAKTRHATHGTADAGERSTSGG